MRKHLIALLKEAEARSVEAYETGKYVRGILWRVQVVLETLEKGESID